MNVCNRCLDINSLRIFVFFIWKQDILKECQYEEKYNVDVERSQNGKVLGYKDRGADILTSERDLKKLKKQEEKKRAKIKARRDVSFEYFYYESNC